MVFIQASFSWQWTDDFYTKIFFDDYTKMSFMSTIDKVPTAIGEALKYESSAIYESYKATLSGTASILIALPLIVMYVFLQRRIVEGVERSGIVG